MRPKPLEWFGFIPRYLYWLGRFFTAFSIFLGANLAIHLQFAVRKQVKKWQLRRRMDDPRGIDIAEVRLLL